MTKILVTKGAIVLDQYIKAGSILYLDERTQQLKLSEYSSGGATTEFARTCGLSWRKLGRLIEADELVKCIESHEKAVGTQSELYQLAHKHIIDVVNIQPTVGEV